MFASKSGRCFLLLVPRLAAGKRCRPAARSCSGWTRSGSRHRVAPLFVHPLPTSTRPMTLCRGRRGTGATGDSVPLLAPLFQAESQSLCSFARKGRRRRRHGDGVLVTCYSLCWCFTATSDMVGHRADAARRSPTQCLNAAALPRPAEPTSWGTGLTDQGYDRSTSAYDATATCCSIKSAYWLQARRTKSAAPKCDCSVSNQSTASSICCRS